MHLNLKIKSHTALSLLQNIHIAQGHLLTLYLGSDIETQIECRLSVLNSEQKITWK